MLGLRIAARGPGYRGSIVARVSWGAFNWNISDKCQNGSGIIKLPLLFQGIIERLLQASKEAGRQREGRETNLKSECLISSPGKFPYSWEARNMSCCVHARALSIYRLRDLKERLVWLKWCPSIQWVNVQHILDYVLYVLLSTEKALILAFLWF